MQRRIIWILIGKMFINQSFAKSKPVINGKTVQIYGWLSQPRFTISKNQSVTRCSVWCRLLNIFKILKIVTVGLNNGFCNAIRNCYVLYKLSDFNR